MIILLSPTWVFLSFIGAAITIAIIIGILLLSAQSKDIDDDTF